MGNPYALALLFAYTLAAYYVLPAPSLIDRPALTPRRLVSYLVCLSALILAPMLTSSFSAVWLSVAGAGAFIAVDLLHIGVAWMADRRHRLTPSLQRKLFLMTNLLWIIALILLGHMYLLLNIAPAINPGWDNLWQRMGIDRVAAFRWGTALLLVHRPVNLAIAQLLLPYRQEEEDTAAKAKDRNAGRMIGTLERLIILILIALEQYAAIGLVLTAKSIARYDKITKEPAFSEYYLLGTLLSTLAAMIVSRII